VAVNLKLQCSMCECGQNWTQIKRISNLNAVCVIYKMHIQQIQKNSIFLAGRIIQNYISCRMSTKVGICYLNYSLSVIHDKSWKRDTNNLKEAVESFKTKQWAAKLEAHRQQTLETTSWLIPFRFSWIKTYKSLVCLSMFHG
jgi:hypothetical protein